MAFSLGPLFQGARPRLQAVAAGAFGGCAPYIVLTGNQLVGISIANATIGFSYYVGLVIFACLGAAVVFIFEEVTMSKAFYLGISAPAMITFAAAQANPRPAEKNDPGVPSSITASVQGGNIQSGTNNSGSGAVTAREREPMVEPTPTPTLAPNASTPPLNGKLDRNRTSPFEEQWMRVSNAFLAQESQSRSLSSASATVSDPQPSRPRTLEIDVANTSVGGIIAIILDANGETISAEMLKAGQFLGQILRSNARAVVFRKGDTVSDPWSLPPPEGGVKYYEVRFWNPQKKLELGTLFDGEPKIVYQHEVKPYDVKPMEVNATGWCFLGTVVSQNWSTQYLDFRGEGPKKKTVYRITFPLFFREGAGGDQPRIGRLAWNQEVELIDTQPTVDSPPGNGSYWAKVRVVEGMLDVRSGSR